MLIFQNSVIDLTEDEQLALAISESLDQGGDGAKSSGPSSEDMPSFARRIATLPAENWPEPAASDSEATRVQFRFPDNTRAVRRFKKSDPVHALFQFAKHHSAEMTSHPFDVSCLMATDSLVTNSFQLLLVSVSLGEHLDETLEACKVVNAAITMTYL